MAFTSFQNFKKVVKLHEKFHIDLKIWNEKMEFMRKGKVGNWKEYFNDELSRKLDEAVEKNFHNNIRFKYE